MLEFGTGHGHSTSQLANGFAKGKIFTFDGFRGLPKTNKVIPKGTGWWEGNLMSNEQVTRENLKHFSNVIITNCMTWELKTPSEYGIGAISSVNIDVDLYEGTLDALRFADKCEWKELVLRFDDWGYYRNSDQIKEEVSEHEEAAFYDFIRETNYNYSFYDSINRLVDNRQIVVKITR
jgi:hypothetical protein